MRTKGRIRCDANQMRDWEQETGRKARVVDGMQQIRVGTKAFVAPLALPRIPEPRKPGAGS